MSSDEALALAEGGLRKLRDRLRLRRWWDKHSRTIEGLPSEALDAAADAIAAGGRDKIAVARELALRLDAETFSVWQATTTSAIESAAAKRQKVREAVEELGNNLLDAAVVVLRSIVAGRLQ